MVSLNCFKLNYKRQLRNKSKTEKKIKILLVARWPVGGIRTFISYFYSKFDRSKYELTILAPVVRQIEGLLNDLKEFDTFFIPVNNRFSNFRFFLSVLKTIATKNYDLVHSHGFTAGIFSSIPAFIKYTPHIMTQHESLTEGLFNGIYGATKLKALKIFLRIITIIHCVSNDARENLLKYVPQLRKYNTKIIVIPNGVDLEKFSSSDKRNFKKELKFYGNTFLIGFLGRFMSPKGFRYLIDAVDILKNRYKFSKKLVVLAFGAGGFIEQEKKLIQDRRLTDYIIFMPFTENVFSTIKGLDVVVMPSIWEGCGLLAMETMISGTPLIGTNCIGLREVLENTPCVMVPTRDGNALADAIYNEMKRPSKDAAYNFRNKAKYRFDVSIQSKRLQNVILSLTRKK